MCVMTARKSTLICVLALVVSPGAVQAEDRFSVDVVADCNRFIS
jgi:hypothetical protein